MRIGYACLTIGIKNTELRSCTMKNANADKLYELISANLNSLNNMIEYNIENDIKLFRISSDLIPFGSSPINQLPWWELFEEQFKILGAKITDNGMRVSMHPGQYTVLNSSDEKVVSRAINDLNYHSKVLDCLRLGPEHKIVLHIGGVYNNKEKAMQRFLVNYHKLSPNVQRRLIIENDDKSYHIQDVLNIGKKLHIPVVFDNLHHNANPPSEDYPVDYWINECEKTWQENDGPQKIHYSQQNPLKKAGSHSDSIRIYEFLDFINKLNRADIDIMLEVKDKNLSAIKCINCTTTDQRIKKLELEWNKYKYTILEKSQLNYNEIRTILNHKKAYPVFSFYQLLEDALQKSGSIDDSVNAALHVWGYLKDEATTSEKRKILKNIDDYKQGKLSIKSVKNSLKRLALKYEKQNLLESYYFIL